MQAARWNEVRIFYLVDSLRSIRKREDEFYLLAEYLHTFGTFNLNAVIRHVAEFMRSPHTHPSRDEVIILAALAGYRFPEVAPFLPVPKATFYDIIKRVDTSVWIHPCLAPDSIREFEGFLYAYDKIQGGTLHARRAKD